MCSSSSFWVSFFCNQLNAVLQVYPGPSMISLQTFFLYFLLAITVTTIFILVTTYVLTSNSKFYIKLQTHIFSCLLYTIKVSLWPLKLNTCHIQQFLLHHPSPSALHLLLPYWIMESLSTESSMIHTPSISPYQWISCQILHCSVHRISNPVAFIGQMLSSGE